MAKAKEQPGKGKGKKPPRATKRRSPVDGGSKIPAERLQLVEKMLAARCTQRDITHALIEQFSVSKTTAWGYVQIVQQEWQAEVRPKRRYLRAMAMKSLDRCLTGAMADRCWSAAARLIEVQAKLLGLNEPDEVQVTVVEDDPINALKGMTSPQIRAYMAERMEHREAILAEPIIRPTPPTAH